MISQTIFPVGERGTRGGLLEQRDMPARTFPKQIYSGEITEEGLRLSDRGKKRVINFSPRGREVKITDNS